MSLSEPLSWGQLSTESPFTRDVVLNSKQTACGTATCHLTSGLGYATPSWKGCELTVGTQRFAPGVAGFPVQEEWKPHCWGGLVILSLS